MCGGEGTRLRPLTLVRPKPLIPILNKPVFQHLLEHLYSQGFTDIVVTLGYKGKMLENFFGDGSFIGVSLTYVYEDVRLGTAGSVKNAEKHLDDCDYFLVGAGDHITRLNLREMFRFHDSHDGIATIAVTCVSDPREYGIMDVSSDFRILRFKEKPKVGEIFSVVTSTGIYVLDSEILDWIPPREEFDFAKNLFPMLLEEGEKIYAWFSPQMWSDIGNPESYLSAGRWMLESMNQTTISGNVRIEGARVNGPVRMEGEVSLGRNSRVVGPSMIGEGCIIEESSLIGPYSSLGSSCVIGKNSSVISSHLFQRVEIGRNCRISSSILDEDVEVGDGCVIENGAVIGKGVRIGENSVIHSGVKIWPGVEIKPNSEITSDIIIEGFNTY